MLDHISCHEKKEKRIHWKKKTCWYKEKMGLKMGFTKNWCGKSAQKHKDLRKYWRRWVNEGWEAWKFIFFGEEMVRWRRKIKWRKKMNSVNGGRKVMKEEAKREKEKRDKTNRGPKFSPHTFSWVAKSTQSNWVDLVNTKKKIHFHFHFLFFSFIFFSSSKKKSILKKKKREIFFGAD